MCKFKFAVFLTLISLVDCCFAQRVPIDQVPMYGGLDRTRIPELKAGDEKFITEVTAHFGSRETAGRAWIEQGFKFYYQGNLVAAMRRFNQAWLLDPNNPDTYWGFAAVLQDQQKFCDAIPLTEMAFAKGPVQDGFLPDAAVIYAGCAAQNASLSPDAKQSYLKRVDDLFAQAYASPRVRKEYTLYQWARAMYGRGDYASAWTKVAEYRKLTGKEFDQSFLQALSAKMLEPK